MVKFHFLNHSSILTEIEDISILTDPWYFGTCFEGGWGLRFDNPNAFELAEKANYLWISHFHSDHFHVPTLKKLLEINPGIKVLGNHSYNFQLDESMKGIGFKNVITFYERQTLEIENGIQLTRYPTTGIDNMLHIKYKDISILNYNDCNIPSLTQKMLRRKIGNVDVLLTNFNHAGKLLLYPYPKDEVIKDKLKAAFKNNYDVFSPSFILPFASHHYYKAEESFYQNSSHLTSDELLMLDKRILNWKVGDLAVFEKDKQSLLIDSKGNQATANPLDKLVRGNSKTLDELAGASLKYVKNIKQQFGLTTMFLPQFWIEIADLNIIVKLDTKKGIVKADKVVSPHIRAHSDALFKWWDKKYGTDSFIVGAHFEISDKNKIPLYWQIIFGMLIDNKLDMKSILTMLFKKSGRGFLLNRREEILGILTSFKLAADYQKQD